MFWDVYGEKCFGMFRRRIECLAGEKTDQEYNGANQHCGSTNQPFPKQPFHPKQLSDCNTKSINFQRENEVSFSICEKSPFKNPQAPEKQQDQRAAGPLRVSLAPAARPRAQPDRAAAWAAFCQPAHPRWSLAGQVRLILSDFICWVRTSCNWNVEKMPIFITDQKSQLDMLLMRQNANYKLYLNLRRCQFWWNAKV